MMISPASLSAAQTETRGANDLREAATLLRDRQFPAAAAAYQKILRGEPRNEKAELGLAAAYFGVYNYDEMRRLLQESAREHPKSAAALAELGKLDIHLLHYDEAITELTRAVARDPASARAHEQLGVAYQAKDDVGKALTQLNEAIRLAPMTASAHYFRGRLYADGNETGRAYDDAKTAYGLEPNSQARQFLAEMALQTKRCDESIALLENPARPEETDPQNLYLLAKAYQCAGQEERARTIREEFERKSAAEREAKRRKMNADHLATTAGEMARNNRLAEALAALSEGLRDDPENAPSLAQLAKIDYSRGEMAKANDEIERALRSDPYNPDYLYVKGKVLENSDPVAALSAFRQTVLVDPREADAYYEMGEIYLKMGERTQAEKALRAAVRLSPDDSDYRKALAELGGKPAR